MKEVRYFFVPDASAHNELPNEEGQHATRVLRLEAGDEVFLMDGVGQFYRAVLTLVTQKRCLYEITETLPQAKAWSGRIHLAIAPTKNIDRIEWIAEKCSEIGWDELSFLHCKFSERKTLRTDRIEKIIISAVKQSRKGWKPTVNEMSPFHHFIENCSNHGRKYICHCYPEIARTDFFTAISNNESSLSGDDITVLVGPEGDFSIDEVRYALAHGFESVTLGNSRLRTETAGLSAVMMSQLARRV